MYNGAPMRVSTWMVVGALLVVVMVGVKLMQPKPPPPPASLWPALPKSGFISGRLATAEDGQKGNAVFVGKGPGRAALPVKIPQYAYRVDGSGKYPGIILQAEEMEHMRVVGFIRLGATKPEVGGLEEFELLGKEPPPGNPMEPVK